jgi:hypothetical protein
VIEALRGIFERLRGKDRISVGCGVILRVILGYFREEVRAAASLALARASGVFAAFLRFLSR